MIYWGKGTVAIDQNSYGRMLIIGIALPGLAQTYWRVFMKSLPLRKADKLFFSLCVVAAVAFYVHIFAHYIG
jgi:hypothetical protein